MAIAASIAQRSLLAACKLQIRVLSGLAASALSLNAQSGALDPNFASGEGVDAAVYAIALQNDGGILLGGNFTSFNGVGCTNIARLNSDGHLDSGFDSSPAPGDAFSYVNAIALQAGGKIILGGSFACAAATNVARLNSNGTTDAGFKAQTDGTVNCVLVQTNGSVVIGGFFTQVNGATRSGVARLTADGILDNTFNPALSGAFLGVRAMALQTDGKIIIGGSFTSIDGGVATNIARLYPDGSLDTTFTKALISGGQFYPGSPVFALAVDGQGRVLAGGDFASVGGLVRSNLVRFNRDGSPDRSFNPAGGTDAPVEAIAVQADGKVLLAGDFTLVNDCSRGHIARLNSDGSLDTSFNPGSGADDVVYAVALQSDLKVLIGGWFVDFNGVTCGGIARLENPPQIVNPVFSNHVFQASIATVSGKSYILEFKDALTDHDWTQLPAVPGDGGLKTLTDPFASGPRRYYRVLVQ
jgi:uncharacterized delta-60 repeat protein